MEEKLLVLETLEVFKEFVSNDSWRTIHGTKTKLFTSARHSEIKFLQNISVFDKVIAVPEIGNGCTDSQLQSLQEIEKVKDRIITYNLKSTMEGTKSEINIPGGGKFLENEDQLNNNDCKQKTDKIDILSNRSLICLSDEKKEEPLALKSFEKIDVNGSDDFQNENIPQNNEIPLKVQHWVNHLPTENKCSKEIKDVKIKDEVNNCPTEDIPQITTRLSREASVQSNSSLDSLLDSRRPDPVEIFLNLGFGGVPGVNYENCRIPKRFLVPSKCKGGDWNEFLKRELIQAQNFECSSLGFRGLSGPSYRRPSAIVANIMEKLREKAVGQPHARTRFSSVAKKVLNEKSVLNKLQPETQSVLSPDNRKFLQNQGKISPEVPRRRIIFGQKSFAFARDGEFIEIESPSSGAPSSAENSSAPKTTEIDKDEPPSFPNPEVLLKLRRSSLQKQKKVEEDPETDELFYIVGKEEPTAEKDSNYSSTEKRAQKTGKIPKRFFSSSNLKALEKESDFSEAMRMQIEKEIITLSQKIKNIGDQELATVLEQIKQLRSRLENISQDSSEQENTTSQLI